jgi:hypothetical protein
MAAFEQTFHLNGEEIHAVVLRQPSRFRWNAFLWGSGVKFSNSFARREGAEKWLKALLLRRFPTLSPEITSRIGRRSRPRARRTKNRP